eukprot:TRINITY_DN15850_c0_g1_i1.p1 TRINITY_DN15850_c0_g1~~TRINITY_DN15850_c0_g1_i1.p1  ORF type:complete len:129 (+),score=2.30 TRINITY_DN15850_c0_g1_i1:130-516(+)
MPLPPPLKILKEYLFRATKGATTTGLLYLFFSRFSFLFSFSYEENNEKKKKRKEPKKQNKIKQKRNKELLAPRKYLLPYATDEHPPFLPHFFRGTRTSGMLVTISFLYHSELCPFLPPSEVPIVSPYR